MDSKIKIAISTCLLGEKVRFDGGHKHDRYLTGTLGEYFEWLPICPEVEIGLGTPRHALRLENSPDGVRMVQPKTDSDITDKMQKYAKRRVQKLHKQSIFGYILKSKSPSCGMERVKIYNGYGVSPNTKGVGLYAQALLEEFPNLPVEEEGRLCDPILRENWVNRVFIYHAYRTQLYPRPTLGKLVSFHTQHKFTILSHCNATYSKMGQLVGNAKKIGAAQAAKEYEDLLMQALKKRATSRKHTNVMEHMIGFFKKDLPSATRKEILTSIADYRSGHVPVIVPITLIAHYAKILNVEYLMNQSYLHPHPKELALRSRI